MPLSMLAVMWHSGRHAVLGQDSVIYSLSAGHQMHAGITNQFFQVRVVSVALSNFNNSHTSFVTTVLETRLEKINWP